ncbi:MAG: tRNA (guanosine(37)-N1)-methyltransferase TrmD [Bacilli bacterium]|nr:tRNA (guanosine(37)-N1)-methyltransferase TrmD [Bacilli bacterium]
MKIDILTLFPNMFDSIFNESIIKRAIKDKVIELNAINIRDYSNDSKKRVDDTPYGGGAGMILKCQPIFDAVKDLQKKNSKVILMTPQGITFNQKIANDLSKEKHLIVVCGHYEGFDERIRSICDMEISIGDYVLTGGEIPAMVLTDSVVRLVDGVIEKDSYENDSFQKGLLDYPQYTKPKKYNDMEVPDILLGGDHKDIDEYRKKESVKKTKEKRPDLIENITYVLVKDKKKKKVNIDFKNIKGYDICPKNNAKRNDIIDVRRMSVVDKFLMTKIAKRNIERKLQIILKLIVDESDDDNETKILSEAERIKQLMFLSYEKILSEEYKESIKKRLEFIIKNIESKKKEEVIEEKTHKSK